ncbi:MAG: hypothetical protein JOZ68_10885 [Acidimicrobiia bacterium]|nr:hypothetical protein [Acidimicrobiia bacterium]MBV9041504.1 hypothetical protein [Acidimicrobiia bacterium]
MDDVSGVRPSWPAAAICRIVPVALLAIGVGVPALSWSTLPSNRPGGWLILAISSMAIGLVIMVPQMLKPRGWAPRQWEGSDYSFFGVWGFVGLVLTQLRNRFGPTAAGLLMLGLGVGVSVATTTASSHATNWHLSLLGFGLLVPAALVVATLGGAGVRHYGRFVDRDGHYVPRRSPIGTGA